MTGPSGASRDPGTRDPATSDPATRDPASWLDRRDAVVMPTYARPVLTLLRGSGCAVWDSVGREYLDLIGGIAVSALGHGHPRVARAVARQLTTLAHTSNLFGNVPSVLLAERLVKILDLPPGTDARVFFCNSGAEANEAAIKIAFRTGRRAMVSAEGSFHGRTLGALSITGQPAKRAPFEPLLGPVTFVPYGDLASLREAVSEQTAAVFLEPIQGEGGLVTPPPGYLAAARVICDRTGALLVVDEVQSGIARSGSWFASRGEAVLPDVVTLAKGLAGGLPIGAAIGIGRAATLLRPGDHATTFGGNPVACAAALAVLDEIEENDLLAHVRSMGAHLADRLRALQDPLLAAVRGRGLWLGLVLIQPIAAQFEAAAREAGFLVNAVAPAVVRLAPPLVVTDAELGRFVERFPEIARAAERAA